MAVNDDGKYTKFTEETVKKLEEAFAIDATVEEACFYANITRPTYYGWIKKNPKLQERFNSLREKPVLLARQTAVKKIQDSYANAMDYLSRKRKGEFSQRQEQTGANGQPLQVNLISYKEEDGDKTLSEER